MSIPSFILEPAINLVMPAFVSGIAAVLYQKAKQGSAWMAAPERAKLHEFVFGALAILQPVIAKYLPGFDPAQLADIQQPAVQSLVALLAGKVVHAILKRK